MPSAAESFRAEESAAAAGRFPPTALAVFAGAAAAGPEHVQVQRGPGLARAHEKVVEAEVMVHENAVGVEAVEVGAVGMAHEVAVVPVVVALAHHEEDHPTHSSFGQTSETSAAEVEEKWCAAESYHL